MWKMGLSRSGFILLSALLMMQACAGSGQFTRVEKFPEGEQRSLVLSELFPAGANAVERIYTAPYEQVWSVVKRVAERFDKIGGRPIVAMDEKNGRIQNGDISRDRLIGLDSGAWIDVFVMEATAVSGNQTKVRVARRVIENVYRRGRLQWEGQVSNGAIESWLHTQIEDELIK